MESIKKCECCGCDIDIRNGGYYKMFLKEWYFCELHAGCGESLDEERWEDYSDY